jgi:hypothetical protein
MLLAIFLVILPFFSSFCQVFQVFCTNEKPQW